MTSPAPYVVWAFVAVRLWLGLCHICSQGGGDVWTRTRQESTENSSDLIGFFTYMNQLAKDIKTMQNEIL